MSATGHLVQFSPICSKSEAIVLKVGKLLPRGHLAVSGTLDLAVSGTFDC